MSIEQLLFLLLLIALPLFERLIRAMRTRTNDSSGERAGTIAESAVSGSRPPGSPQDASGTAADGRQTELTLPASPLPPDLPRAVRHTVREPLRPLEGALHVRREGNRGLIARLRAGGRLESRRALAPVIVSDDLRRAIVFIAVLGPCRALEPKDASRLNR